MLYNVKFGEVLLPLLLYLYVPIHSYMLPSMLLCSLKKKKKKRILKTIYKHIKKYFSYYAFWKIAILRDILLTCWKKKLFVIC